MTAFVGVGQLGHDNHPRHATEQELRDAFALFAFYIEFFVK